MKCKSREKLARTTVQNNHQVPYNSNDTIRRSKRLAAADEQSAASGIGARCIAVEEMFVTGATGSMVASAGDM